MSQGNPDWRHKGELYTAQWALERNAARCGLWLRVNLPVKTTAGIIHECKTCHNQVSQMTKANTVQGIVAVGHQYVTLLQAHQGKHRAS